MLAFCQQAHTAVNDIFPGDFYPPAPGGNTLSLYAFDRVHQGPYVNRTKVIDGQIDSSALALRAVHGIQWGDTTLSTVAVLPWFSGSVSPTTLSGILGKDAEGLADVRLGLTAWLVNDKATANYLALGGMVIVPSGQYDSRQILNAGENRWKYILFGGWQKDITPKLLFELSPEIALYGDNNDYAAGRKMEQRTSYALTGYLRWRAAPTFHLHVGAQANRGGETRVNGVDQNNVSANRRLMAGLTWFLPDKQQIILRTARDTSIDNGFKLRREFAIRYQKSF